jgi:hypothetical protein
MFSIIKKDEGPPGLLEGKTNNGKIVWGNHSDLKGRNDHEIKLQL